MKKYMHIHFSALVVLILMNLPGDVVGQPYQVTGRLQTENASLSTSVQINEPLLGIKVKLFQGETLLDSTLTNSNGEYTLSHSVENGSLQIEVVGTSALQSMLIGESSKNPKKGFGIGINSTNNWEQKLVELESSWHYNWANQIPDSYPHEKHEYVPMIWKGYGNFSGIDGIVERVNTWAEEGKVHYLLGFNEPDGANQANMTVEQAIEAWPKLMKANVPLISPVPVHADGQWLEDFMNQAKALGYRVDYIGVHWYKGPNADNLINELQATYEKFGLPIWLTEFGVADWSANTPAENKYSEQQVVDFLEEVLPRLDELDFIKRYAWFNSNPESGPLTTSALFDTNDNLTTLGLVYKNHTNGNGIMVGANFNAGNTSVPWKGGNVFYNGESYRTVTIGEQIWMAENLRTSKYRNGDDIPKITDNTEWSNLTTGSWSIHDNAEEESAKDLNRGKLYNWFAVNDERGLCPPDWTVPSDIDFKKLEETLGMSVSDLEAPIGNTWVGTDVGVGNVLRSTGGGGDFFWRDDNTDEPLATNATGFSMRGTSLRFPGGGFGSGGGDFSSLGEIGMLWSSTEDPDNLDLGIRRIFRSNQAGVRRNTVAKTAGISVRCVQINDNVGTSIEGTDYEQTEQPRLLKLSQNYPNPFNPSTQISFDIAQSSKVQLEVFDLLGRRVAVLINEFRNPGNYQVGWDASSLSSGIYMYRLVAGEQVITKQMTLLK